MINKEILGQRLRQLMDSYQETNYSLAKVLGLAPATVWRYTKSENVPKMTTIIALADYFDVNPKWLTGESSNYFKEEPIELLENEEKSSLIVYEKILYDLPILSNERAKEELELSFDTVSKWGPCIAVRVNDDAMAPYLKRGDVAVIKLKPDITDEKFAALHVNDSEMLIRKVVLNKNRVILQPSNIDYDACEVHKNEVQKIGSVVYSRSIEERFFD